MSRLGTYYYFFFISIYLKICFKFEFWFYYAFTACFISCLGFGLVFEYGYKYESGYGFGFSLDSVLSFVDHETYPKMHQKRFVFQLNKSKDLLIWNQRLLGMERLMAFHVPQNWERNLSTKLRTESKLNPNPYPNSYLYPYSNTSPNPRQLMKQAVKA